MNILPSIGQADGYGYAVEILENKTWTSGDDGVEVRDSGKTLVAGNRIHDTGLDTTGEPLDWDNEWDFGAGDGDGIHIENVHAGFGGVVNSGIGGGAGNSVEVLGNVIKRTGDDGVEVVDSGRTLIAGNKISDVGVGRGEHYGTGDYYGADGIHVRNVRAFPNNFDEINVVDEMVVYDGYLPAGEPSDYATVIVDNRINRTADDGIEVVGEKIKRDEDEPKVVSDSPSMYSPFFGTDRTLIAWNTVRNSGYGAPSEGEGESYGDYAPDGYGADAIHVRGIQGEAFRPRLVQVRSTGMGEYEDYGYERPLEWEADGYGYAVEILENRTWTSGDDGAEVRDSGKTLVAGNRIHDTGLNTSTEPLFWINDWDFGANDGDGIHIENVHAGFGGGMTTTTGMGGGAGNSVEVLDNVIRHTGDDGVEVHYSGRTLVAGNRIFNAGVGGGQSYEGGDEGYGHDAIHVGGVHDDYSYEGPDYSVRILDNKVDTTGDDGAEVHYSGRTLIANNKFSHIGYGDYGYFEGLDSVDEIEGGYFGLGDESGADAIHVMGVYANDGDGLPSVDVFYNTVDVTADDGVEVVDSGYTVIEMNTLTNIGHGFDRDYGGADRFGADGIHVRNVAYDDYGYGDYGYGMMDEDMFDVEIIHNDITDVGDDGIEVNETDYVLVDWNTVDQAGDDGINVLFGSPFDGYETDGLLHKYLRCLLCLMKRVLTLGQ